MTVTDIPKVYLDEAERRYRHGPDGYYYAGNWSLKVLARTLQELGWQPPVDPMLVRAREIAARAYDSQGWGIMATEVRDGDADCSPAVQAALIALREGMGK